MDDSETYHPTWRDDAELDALLLAAKVRGLADLDAALDIRAGHGAIVTGDSLPSAPTGSRGRHGPPRSCRNPGGCAEACESRAAAAAIFCDLGDASRTARVRAEQAAPGIS